MTGKQLIEFIVKNGLENFDVYLQTFNDFGIGTSQILNINIEENGFNGRALYLQDFDVEEIEP